jgi:hypothetical protein
MQHNFRTVYDSTLYLTLRIRIIVPQIRKNGDENGYFIRFIQYGRKFYMILVNGEILK